MSFDPTKPSAGSQLSISRSQIQTNFSTSNTSMGIDHVAFDGGANTGRHNKISFVRQAVAPGSAATQLVAYQKLLGSASELYFQRDNVATEILLTNASANPSNTASATEGQDSGYTFIPGGFILQWGFRSAATGSAITFSSTGGIAFPTRLFSLQLTVAGSTLASISHTADSTTGFTIQHNSGGVLAFTYLALGN